MTDLKKFKHGEEGTHAACIEMVKKSINDEIVCCECSGHECIDNINKTCEYRYCQKKTFATTTESFGGMRLCEDHFKMLFGEMIKNAKIEDKTSDE